MDSISDDLIAPCGMNCAICSRYLAYRNGLKRSHCIGCRPKNERCLYLFAKCPGNNHSAMGDAAFCFECDQYPCQEINRMDKRYRENYHMSVKENLDFIEKKGIIKFIEDQYQKYHCPDCGGLISIHNRKCFQCDTVTRLVEKIGQEYKS